VASEKGREYYGGAPPITEFPAWRGIVPTQKTAGWLHNATTPRRVHPPSAKEDSGFCDVREYFLGGARLLELSREEEGVRDDQLTLVPKIINAAQTTPNDINHAMTQTVTALEVLR